MYEDMAMTMSFLVISFSGIEPLTPGLSSALLETMWSVVPPTAPVWLFTAGGDAYVGDGGGGFKSGGGRGGGGLVKSRITNG
jgi:hypothetical protein